MVRKVSQGDIFYVNFNPSQGHEQRNLRPAIAISHDTIRDKSGMTIVAPISSTERDFPTYHSLNSTTTINGKVLLDQTKALDLYARNITKEEVIETISKKELQDIIDLYKLLFTVD